MVFVDGLYVVVEYEVYGSYLVDDEGLLFVYG